MRRMDSATTPGHAVGPFLRERSCVVGCKTKNSRRIPNQDENHICCCSRLRCRIARLPSSTAMNAYSLRPFLKTVEATSLGATRKEGPTASTGEEGGAGFGRGLPDRMGMHGYACLRLLANLLCAPQPMTPIPFHALRPNTLCSVTIAKRGYKEAFQGLAPCTTDASRAAGDLRSFRWQRRRNLPPPWTRPVRTPPLRGSSRGPTPSSCPSVLSNSETRQASQPRMLSNTRTTLPWKGLERPQGVCVRVALPHVDVIHGSGLEVLPSPAGSILNLSRVTSRTVHAYRCCAVAVGMVHLLSGPGADTHFPCPVRGQNKV